ncbi:MAG TPA: LacI family DNA-binding transcriptional regulator [Propionibacteriaceae bacterium]|nr:LacI family DNA-binding transcriptional regulator [Propionibacteriaceae bacterium]
MAKRPTMHDVAAAAGVSQATVSLVLGRKRSNRVSDETAERVVAAATNLGYRTNVHAKVLREGHSRMIGIIGSEIATAPFAGEMILGAQTQAWESGHVLLTVDTAGDTSLAKAAIDMMMSYGVVGIIYAAMYHQAVTLPTALAGIRTVCANARDSSGATTSIIPDEFRGGVEAAETLLEAGHRRIAMINIAEEGSTLPAAAGRIAGFTQTLAQGGVPIPENRIGHGLGNFESGHEWTRTLMAREEPPTAIFCANDRTALGAYQALSALGLSVPDDVSIIGFDDQSLLGPLFEPPLTTFQLPLKHLGRLAVEEILNPSSAGPRTIPVHCPIQTRASVAQPKEQA